MEYKECWSEQKEAYVKVLDIQISKCGELTFVNGFESKTFAVFMNFLHIFDNVTCPDLCVYNNTTIDVARTSIYGSFYIGLWNGLKNEIYIRKKNSDNCLFICENHKKTIQYVTLIWLPSRLQVYCLFEELNLFDEINLIDVILNFVTFKR